MWRSSDSGLHPHAPHLPSGFGWETMRERECDDRVRFHLPWPNNSLRNESSSSKTCKAFVLQELLSCRMCRAVQAQLALGIAVMDHLQNPSYPSFGSTGAARHVLPTPMSSSRFRKSY